MKILDKSPCSDHLPIYAKLKLDIDLSVLASSSVPASDVTFPIINYISGQKLLMLMWRTIVTVPKVG